MSKNGHNQFKLILCCFLSQGCGNFFHPTGFQNQSMLLYSSCRNLVPISCHRKNLQTILIILFLFSFSADVGGLEDPGAVSELHSRFQHELQQYISHANGSNANDGISIKRYSRLLLCLPTMYTIEPAMLEALFCRQSVIDQGGVTGLIDRLLWIPCSLEI